MIDATFWEVALPYSDISIVSSNWDQDKRAIDLQHDFHKERMLQMSTHRATGEIARHRQNEMFDFHRFSSQSTFF